MFYASNNWLLKVAITLDFKLWIIFLQHLILRKNISVFFVSKV